MEGYSAVLYLAGGGTMTFMDAQTGVVKREVGIVPCRMIVWDNASLSHKVDVGNATAPRVMLGDLCVRLRGCLCACKGVLARLCVL